MTPQYLEIENLNSFTDTQTVDFTRFLSDRLFCICGNTGAGKTTVLDAVIVALYGIKKESEETRSGREDFINVRADRARVAFAFALDGKVCKVERIYHRSGAAKAYLYEDDTLIAQGMEAVNAAVEERVGLTRDEFTQVIILQQGAFSRFLIAKQGSRTETVSKLFKLSRFDLHGRVNKTVGELREELASLDGRLEPLVDLTDKELRERGRQLKALEKQVKENEDAYRTAADALEALKEAGRKYAAYLTAENRRKELEAALSQTAARYREACAVPAETREAAAEAAERAAREAAQAVEDLTRKRRAAETLRDLRARLEELRGKYKETEKEEKRLEQACAEARERLERDQADLAQAQSAAAAAAAGFDPAGDFAALAQAASAEAARRKAMLETWERAETERQKAAALVTELTALRERERQALAAAAASAGQRKETLAAQRRSAAAAAVLEGLADGDPCPVCGGTVTKKEIASDVEAASAAYEAAEAERAAIERRLAQTEERLTAAEKAAAQGPPRPADPQPCRLAADLAAKAAAARLRLNEGQAALTKTEGERQVAAAKKQGFFDQGTDVKRNVERYTAEAGEYASFDAERLEATARRLARAADDAALKAQREKQAAKEAGEAVKRLEAEKARLEGEYAAAAAAAVPVPEVAAERSAEAERQILRLADKRDELTRAAAAAQQRIETDRQNWEKKRLLEAERASVFARYDTADRLAKLLKEKALVKFVAEEYIRAFTAAASVRLGELSGGKYALSYENGVFSISDFLNGDSKRRVVTLSGGETFLASLSMAAAISDMLASSVRYGFFFLDEGFGTLDESRLDSVYEALLTLSQDTLVGVVTHSRALIERIPARLTVLAADGERGSRIV